MGAHSIGYHSQILRNTMISPIWKGCQAGISVLGIESDGSVKGCLSLPDNGFIEGNIRDRCLTDIWNDSKVFTFTREFQNKNLKNKCEKCKFGNSCKGGCTTVSSSINDEIHYDPHCLYSIENKMMDE